MKWLYCKRCKCFPDRVIEKYLKPLLEVRYWNGDCYELQDTNIDCEEYTELCGNCETKLVNIEGMKKEEKEKVIQEATIQQI